MKKLLGLLVLCTSWCCLCRDVLGQPLQWVAGELPPFIWLDHGKPTGYANDLVEAMAEKLGRHDVVALYPWARAVRMATDGPNFGVFPLARTPDREDKFRWLIPLVKVRYVFLELDVPPIAGARNYSSSLEELKSKRIGLLRGSPIIINLKNNGFATVVELSSYMELLDALSRGVIDAVYAGDAMIMASVAQSKHRERAFRKGTFLGESDLYLATSLKVDSVEFEKWQKAYAKVLQDGKVAKLRKNYAISAPN